MRLSRALATAATLLAWLATPRSAWARPPNVAGPVSYRLEVERAPEVKECPGQRGLVERLGALLGPDVVREASGEPDAVVRVRLSRKKGDYVGEIRAEGVRAGERTLSSPVPKGLTP